MDLVTINCGGDMFLPQCEQHGSPNQWFSPVWINNIGGFGLNPAPGFGLFYDLELIPHDEKYERVHPYKTDEGACQNKQIPVENKENVYYYRPEFTGSGDCVMQISLAEVLSNLPNYEHGEVITKMFIFKLP